MYSTGLCEKCFKFFFPIRTTRTPFDRAPNRHTHITMIAAAYKNRGRRRRRSVAGTRCLSSARPRRRTRARRQPSHAARKGSPTAHGLRPPGRGTREGVDDGTAAGWSLRRAHDRREPREHCRGDATADETTTDAVVCIEPDDARARVQTRQHTHTFDTFSTRTHADTLRTRAHGGRDAYNIVHAYTRTVG